MSPLVREYEVPGDDFARAGEASGHIKSMLAGSHCVLPVKDGNMVLGHAQDIYFAEFDGIKNRKYYIQVMGE